MKRKFSRAMGQRVGELTERIFNDAIRDVMQLDSNFPLDDIVYELRYAKLKLFFGSVEPETAKLLEQKKEIDDLYLQKLCGLSSEQLQEIVLTHEAGVIVRAPKTIESILSELASREIFGDSTESDSRYTYEVVDEPAETSQFSSEETKDKGSDPNKDR